jgi:hypothetical protein
MTTLRIRTEEYSTMRHQLGLTTSAPNFITYREALNANTITIDNVWRGRRNPPQHRQGPLEPWADGGRIFARHVHRSKVSCTTAQFVG